MRNFILTEEQGDGILPYVIILNLADAISKLIKRRIFLGLSFIKDHIKRRKFACFTTNTTINKTGFISRRIS